MKTLANIFQVAIAISGIVSWLLIAYMLIYWSTCPIVGWFILTMPIVLSLFACVMAIVDVVRKEIAEREAAAAMGKAYEPSDAKANELANQKSNQSIAQ